MIGVDFHQWLDRADSQVFGKPHSSKSETVRGHNNGPLADPETMERWFNVMMAGDRQALDVVLQMLAATAERFAYYLSHTPNLTEREMNLQRYRIAGLMEFEEELRRLIQYRLGQLQKKNAQQPPERFSSAPRAARLSNPTNQANQTG